MRFMSSDDSGAPEGSIIEPASTNHVKMVAPSGAAVSESPFSEITPTCSTRPPEEATA
jgi:hypothetical protein